jgi:hypothetical protein
VGQGMTFQNERRYPRQSRRYQSTFSLLEPAGKAAPTPVPGALASDHAFDTKHVRTIQISESGWCPRAGFHPIREP